MLYKTRLVLIKIGSFFEGQSKTGNQYMQLNCKLMDKSYMSWLIFFLYQIVEKISLSLIPFVNAEVA